MVLSLSGDTPMPDPQVTLPPNADATEIGLFDQAHNSFVSDTGPAAFAHNQEVAKWYNQQMAAYQAHKKQAQSKAQAASGPSSTVRQSPSKKKLKCYNLDNFLENKPKDKHSYYIKEHCRQLKMQQNAINSNTVDQFNQSQQNFANNGRLNNKSSHKAGLLPGYIQELVNGGMSMSEAQSAGSIAAPLHNPDQVWGNSVVDALGDPNVNSSIGGGAPSRIAEFKDYLKNSNPKGDSKLNVNSAQSWAAKKFARKAKNA